MSSIIFNLFDLNQNNLLFDMYDDSIHYTKEHLTDNLCDCL